MHACLLFKVGQLTVHVCLLCKVCQLTVHVCLLYKVGQLTVHVCLLYKVCQLTVHACLLYKVRYVPVFCGQNNKSLRCYGRWNPKIAQALNIDNHHNSTRPFFTDNLKNVYRKYMKMSDTDSNNFNSDKKGTF